MAENLRIEITKLQYSALNDIRGLQQGAHYMVILANETDKGYVLEGTEKTFDHLVRDLYDEVEFEMQPRSALKHLRSLIYKIQPDGDF